MPHLSAGADLRRRPGRHHHDEDARRGLRADAVALARFLAREGRRVTIAGRARVAAGTRAQAGWGRRPRARGLDADPGRYDEASSTSGHRRSPRGSPAFVPADPSFAVSATSSSSVGRADHRGDGHRREDDDGRVLAYLLRREGVTVHASTSARAGNLWPTRELLPPPTDGVVLMELTSSHLCFTTRSPRVAVITCFWPDHLELHGTLARYRAAKEAIVRRQGADDVVVVNEGDAEPRRSPIALRDAASASPRPARWTRARSSTGRRSSAGRRRPLVPHAAPSRRPTSAGAPRRRGDGVGHRRAARDTPAGGTPVPRRPRRSSGRTELIDDGMAATPAKTASSLERYGDGSVVLVSGGELESAGLRVHSSREEQRLLEHACAEARRVARLVVLFGPAAAHLAPHFDPTRTLVAPTSRRRSRSPRVTQRRKGARGLPDVPALARGEGADRPRARGARTNRE